MKNRIAELAETYELKAGELERRILLDALETDFYQRSILQEHWHIQRRNQMDAEREAAECEQEREAHAALPVDERTYGHLRLIKSA